MTTAVTFGITVEQLARELDLAAGEARELIWPFVEAGIVELRDDGRLELVDRDVAVAIGSGAPQR